jgi:hypothetical protein
MKISILHPQTLPTKLHTACPMHLPHYCTLEMQLLCFHDQMALKHHFFRYLWYISLCRRLFKLPTGMFLNKLSYCKIKGSHSGGAEDSSLLGCSTLSLGDVGWVIPGTLQDCSALWYSKTLGITSQKTGIIKHLSKIIYSTYLKSIVSFNVPTKCTYNTWYSSRFIPTCIGITMPSLGSTCQP